MVKPIIGKQEPVNFPVTQNYESKTNNIFKLNKKDIARKTSPLINR